MDLKDWSPANDPHYRDRNVVAFDLDDTLTEKGALPSQVVAHLERAQKAGWLTVLVTGRSAGWADALIKLLPFDALVAENGAILHFWPNLKARRAEREEPRKLYWSPQGFGSKPPAGIRDRHRLTQEKILQAFPDARVASDQPFRTYDLAIDFAEEVDPPLSLEVAERIREIFEKDGAVAKVSSIHVNGWWGGFTKEIGLRELLEKHFQRSLEKNLVYVGDSPNDGPLFKVTAMSVGVANVRAFIGKVRFEDPPRYITEKEAGSGSCELIEHLLKREKRN